MLQINFVQLCLFNLTLCTNDATIPSICKPKYTEFQDLSFVNKKRSHSQKVRKRIKTHQISSTLPKTMTYVRLHKELLMNDIEIYWYEDRIFAQLLLKIQS